MSGFAETDLPGLELCPHGDRRKFCPACNPKPVTRCVHDRWSDQCAKCLAHPPADILAAVALPDLRPEWMIEAECTKLLEQDGWRALRTDPVSDRGRGTGFGEVSMADHQFTRPSLSEMARAEGWCQLLYVEFKAGRNRATKGQLAWHAKERARGFQTWIANEDFPATIEGFREHYAKSGLMRRERWW